jgi:hypothetical protein
MIKYSFDKMSFVEIILLESDLQNLIEEHLGDELLVDSYIHVFTEKLAVYIFRRSSFYDVVMANPIFEKFYNLSVLDSGLESVAKQIHLDFLFS